MVDTSHVPLDVPGVVEVLSQSGEVGALIASSNVLHQVREKGLGDASR